MLHAGDIDSIEMSLDMNAALEEMEMNQPWCDECQVLKQSLEDLRAACNHKATIISDLKQKIIPTDQLITDVYAKQEENQMLTKSLETCRRQCDELDQQLHSALARLEPLREANGKSERQIQRSEKEIEKLKAENEAYKICQQQSNLAHHTLQEKLRKLEDERKDIQANLRRSEARVKKYHDEILARKKEYTELRKENAGLQSEIKALKAALAKHTSTHVPCKPISKNHKVEKSFSKVHEVSDHEMSSLLTCSILQMLPPMMSPMPSSDTELSEAGDSDNDIDHFASQLEAKLGCSDENVPLPNKSNEDVRANIDEANNDEDSDDDDDDFIPVDDVTMPKKSREPLSKCQLKSQMSTGFDTATHDDDRMPQVSKDGPAKCSIFTASVPPTLEFASSVPLVPKVAAKVEVSDNSSDAAAMHRLSALDDTTCDETSSASVLPLDIHNESQGFLSANPRTVSSCPVGENQSPNISSTCSTSVGVSTSTVLSSSSSVSASSIAVSSAVSSASLYSQSVTSLASNCLPSAIPKSMPVCTVETSLAPITSSEVTESSNFTSMYFVACGAPEKSLPSASVFTVPTQSSSGLCHLASACLPVGASDVKLQSTSHEMPVISACAVSAASSMSSNGVPPSSPCVTVVTTQCSGAVILDNVPKSVSRVSRVKSGSSKVVLLTSTDTVLASKIAPLCSPCVTVAAPSISRSILPCANPATSSTLKTDSSSVKVVACNSVPICSSRVEAKASSSTQNTSLLSYVNGAASTPCSSVSASSNCVTLLNSKTSDNASLSSHVVSVSLPTSTPTSCASESASSASLSSPLFKGEMFLENSEFKPEASLSLSSLRSRISLEEIFTYVRIPPPLSPIHSPQTISPRNRKKVQRKPVKSVIAIPPPIISPRNRKKVQKKPSKSVAAILPPQTENCDLPSGDITPISSTPVTVSCKVDVAKQNDLSTLSIFNNVFSFDIRGEAANQKTSVLGLCPGMSNSDTDVRVERGETDSIEQAQSCFPPSNSLVRGKDTKTNAANQQTVSVVSNPAAVLPTMQNIGSSELIESIIKEALALTEDVISIWHHHCKNGQTPTKKPWLTPSQNKLFSDICKQGDETVMREFCKRAVQVLSYRGDNVSTSGNIALCCIFVSICRLLGDVECVRVFVFDAVKCQFYGYASLVTAVAAIWPFPLRCDSNSSDFTPVLCVLQHAILAKSLDRSKPKHVKMQFCLEKLCGWKLPLEKADDIARHLLTHLGDVLDQSPAFSQAVTWNVELAFDLLCVADGWQWSNNFVVVQLLWPILASWSANPAEAKNQAFIEAVIDILGLVMSHCPATSRSNTDHILNVLLKLLREPTVAVSIQISVVRALLLLAKYQPHCCATMCMQWVKDHKNDLDTITKSMLRDFHRQFSSMLKYLSELVID